jgi:FAD/FMN-containing dehydrogenase
MAEGRLLDELARLLGATGFLCGDQVDPRYASDWSGCRGELPQAVLRPADTEQLAAVLALCYAARQPIVAQGGRTGLVGGAVPATGELVISLERMRSIGAVDPQARTVTVEAGATLQAVQEQVEREGFLLPLDLGARGSCTIGGNIATNAGGNRVLRYGMMRDLVLSLEAVLADGTVVGGLRTMRKDNAGYDLKQLFIGSEGTLGIVTRAVLKLQPLPSSHDAALCTLDDFSSALELLSLWNRCGAGGLSAFEVMWGGYYEAVVTTGECSPPLPPGKAYYLLLETQGFNPPADRERLETLLGEALAADLIADAVIAANNREIGAFWAIREGISELLARLKPGFAYDISLPPDAIDAYAHTVLTQVRDRWPAGQSFAFGHIGDGNLHLFVHPGPGDVAAGPRIDAIVYEEAARFGASISGEHGIGVLKRDHLSCSRSSGEIEIMALLKSTLDPRGILAPGRVIPASHA